MKTTRLIPEAKVKDLRFGQLLINALCKSGHLEQVHMRREDINDEKYGRTETAYEVTGTDLFYLENDQLEEILQNFLKP